MVLDIKKDTIGLMPASVPFSQAAMHGVCAETAAAALFANAGLNPAKTDQHKRVLVIGASGGVGRWTVILARHVGCRVDGVCSRAKISLVQGYGAESVFAYDSGDSIADQIGSKRYDIVVDCVGGDDYWDIGQRVLPPSGTYQTAVGPVKSGGSEPVTLTLVLASVGKMVYRLFSHWFGRTPSYGYVAPKSGVYWGLITDLISKVTFPAPTVVPLDDGARAFELLEHHTDRIVVSIRED
jgi:NADPH:quinone reductase-like Zn-dependent oxidoreductase